MNNLEEKIQEHFSQEEIKSNFNNLVEKYFTDEKQKQGFLNVFELVKKGEFDSDDLAEYLSDWYGIEIEKSLKINQKLFEKIYGEVYDELQELYSQKNKEEPVKTDISRDISAEEEKKVGTNVGTSVPTSQDLIQQYNTFINSSLFQNILASQEQVREKYHAGVHGQHGSSQRRGANEGASLPNDFYAAINAGDKIKVPGILRMLAEAGKLRTLFKEDKRYADFFGGFLARHQGQGAKEKFLQDPGNKKYLIEFLKFILEKRLGFTRDESAMLGAGLGMLCQQAGEKELAGMAYGDEEKGSFVWSS